MTRQNLLLHIADPSNIETLSITGRYAHPSLSSEGFIHCCLPDQIDGVIERYFTTSDDLTVFVIDPDKLDRELVMENTVGGAELFPHVYGEINRDAVLAVKAYKEGFALSLLSTSGLESD